MCYAYREPGCSEELSDHLEAVADCVKRRWELQALAHKTARLLMVKEVEAKELIVAAALLHDIGKAYAGLQSACSKKCTSFPCHYVYSAGVAGEALRRALQLKAYQLEEALKAILDPAANGKGYSSHAMAALALAVLPILLHHYAQIEGLDSIERCERNAPNTMKIYDACRESLVRLYTRKASEMTGQVARTLLHKAADTLSKGCLQIVGISLSSSLRKWGLSYIPHPYRFIVEAATGLLNMCDGRVAMKTRRCQQKEQ